MEEAVLDRVKEVDQCTVKNAITKIEEVTEEENLLKQSTEECVKET